MVGQGKTKIVWSGLLTGFAKSCSVAKSGRNPAFVRWNRHHFASKSGRIVARVNSGYRYPRHKNLPQASAKSGRMSSGLPGESGRRNWDHPAKSGKMRWDLSSKSGRTSYGESGRNWSGHFLISGKSFDLPASPLQSPHIPVPHKFRHRHRIRISKSGRIRDHS